MRKSKIQLCTLLIFLFVTNHVYSQVFDTYGREVKRAQFILRSALNISTITRIDTDNKTFDREESKTGYNFSLLVDVALGKNFYLQPGISLTSKGSKARNMDEDRWGGEATLNSVYLQVPFLLVYKIPFKGWNNSMNIGLGPYVAFGVGGKMKGRNSYQENAFGEQGWCNGTDAGYAMEISFEMPKVIFLFGYDYGFAKMLKDEAIRYEYRNSVSFHNTTNYIGIAYKF